MEWTEAGQESDEDVPEISDEADVFDSYAKLNTLLRQFEHDNTEWSNDLYEELNNPIKQNLVNRINVQDEGNEFFDILGTIDHMPDRSDEFEYSQELLNPFKLENELTTLLSHVDAVKIKSSRRKEKLHASFGKVKNAQEAVIDRIIKRIRVDTGLHRLETKVEEYTDQVASLKASLSEKRQIIQRNNKEKDLTAEELRHKHERETEDRVRVLMADIETRNKNLAALNSTHEALKNSTTNLQNDLGVLVHQLEVEERTAPIDIAPPITMNPAQRFRASIYRNATAKGTAITTEVFSGGDISSGAITRELVDDAQAALEEAFEKQQALYASLTSADQRIVALRKELATLMQSEENKALDRLKKVCDNLQVKIQSDEQRVKVMVALVLQMELAEQKKGQIRKTVVDMSKGKNSQTGGQLSSLRGRPNAVSHKSSKQDAAPARSLKNEAVESTVVDIMPLVRDTGDRETISMKLHRRLYSQFYEVTPVADAANSDTDSETEQKVASAKSKKPELPRKRRITASQSRKIQKIMDMINLQYTKLSSMKAADIKHILDYRDFAEEIERGSSSNSSHAGSAKSLTGVQAHADGMMINTHVSEDHTKMLPIQPGILGMGAFEVAVESASPSKPGTAKEGSTGGRTPRSATAPKSPSGRNPAGSNSNYSTSFEEHLRIPTTAALEDDNDAEFYAQNYGIKLALEHLNAFLEVLTNGRGSDTAFLSTDGSKHTRVSFARDEQEELHTVEGLRANIQKLITLIRELHFLSQNAKHMRKGIQKEMDASLKECDRLRNQLLQEIEGSHWPTEMKAGQYELEIEICKARIKELKNVAKQWDHRVSLKRSQNIRLSQLITKASSTRRTITHKLPAHPEERAKSRHNRPASPEKEDTPAPEKKAPAHDYHYSVANKRMSIFDDISHIYDTAMSHIRLTDSSIPYRAGVNINQDTPTGVTADSSVSAPLSIRDVSGILTPRVDAAVSLSGAVAGTASGIAAQAATAAGVKYSGFEEDQGSDGWEDLLHGYEGDKSDIEDGF